MRVLVACEFSGIVRDAFITKGHKAVSCDLLPSEREGPHLCENALNLFSAGWDMMIAFPPCTHLAVSGAAWFAKKRADGRQQAGIDLFMAFAEAPIPKIAIENPVGIMSTVWRKPDQIIQPYEYGHSVSKKTCLWLKGLPKLQPTNIVDRGERLVFPSGKTMDKWYSDTFRLKPVERARERSRTFQGVADAMAEQWG